MKVFCKQSERRTQKLEVSAAGICLSTAASGDIHQLMHGMSKFRTQGIGTNCNHFVGNVLPIG